MRIIMKNKKLFLGTVLVLLVSMLLGVNVNSASAKDSKEKKACAAAIKATGNVKKITYKSTTASDFDAISFTHQKKVASSFFVTSDNMAYCICIARAKNVNYAKKLYKAFKNYKYNKTHDTYFKKDYTKSEQSVLKSAVYGRKGKYVWYISMGNTTNNKKGERAVKKVL